MKLSIICLTVLFFFLSASSLCAGTLYSWTDEKGMTHLSNETPPDNAKEIKEFIFGQSEEESQGPAKTIHEGEEKKGEEGVQGAYVTGIEI